MAKHPYGPGLHLPGDEKRIRAARKRAASLLERFEVLAARSPEVSGSGAPPSANTTSEEPARVIIADDHLFYRDALAELLTASGVEVVASVPSGEATIRAVEQFRPEVVVMGLNMPGISGVETTRELAEIASATRVLVLATSAREADVIDAIVAGASGYVLKEAPVDELVAGIRAAVAGQFFISPHVAMLLLVRVQETGQAGTETVDSDLSARERDVLEQLAEGRTTAEIADSLLVSRGTVRHYISNILIKLHVKNRVEAAERAVRGRPAV